MSAARKTDPTTSKTAARIALGVREEGKTHLVLTILWATDEAWVEDAVKAPLMEGRELRGVAKSLAQEEGVR